MNLVSEETKIESTRRVMRRAGIARWMVVILGGIGLCASLRYLQEVGPNSRVYGETVTPLGQPLRPVEVVESSSEFLTTLSDSGLRGRVLVSMSRFLHFIPVSGVIPQKQVSFPIATFDFIGTYEDRAGPRSVLWVALQTGVVREVVHVLPRQDYIRRRQEISGGTTDVSLRQGSIITHELGSRRTLREDLPGLTEPVILEIDASFLDATESGQAFEMIRRSSLRADLVVLCLSRDNPDVTDLGRERLNVLARELAEPR